MTKQNENSIRLIEGDCRLHLKDVAEKTISLILTDPPYFIDGMSNDWDNEKLNRRKSKAGAIGGLPVGMKFDPLQGYELQKFLKPIAKEWMRILKPGGFALVFAQPRLSHHVAIALEEQGFEIRDLIAWKYEGQAKAFSQDHFIKKRKDLNEDEKAEIIQKLGGRKTPQLKPQMEMIILAQKPKEGRFVDNWLNYQAGLIDINLPFLESSRFPGNVIPHAKTRKSYGHLTPKPVELLRHLIRIFSYDHPDTLILDCFAGSGSTGEAAILENRSFLGYEINQSYCNIANDRLSSCLKDNDNDKDNLSNLGEKPSC